MHNRSIAWLALAILALILFARGGGQAAASHLAAAQTTPQPRPTLPPARPTLPPAPKPTEERGSNESEQAPSATPEPTAAPTDTAAPAATSAPAITPTPPAALPRSGQPAARPPELWAAAALALLGLGGLLAWRASRDRTGPLR